LLHHLNLPIMTRKICLLFALLLPIGALAQRLALQKQNTYLDAVELARIWAQDQSSGAGDNTDLVNAFNTILGRYGVTAATLPTNPFLNGHILNTRAPFAAARVAYADQTDEAAVPTGGSWQALLINATATFMAERFKQEAMHMAIDQLMQKMTNQEKAVVSAVFPSTYQEVVKLYNNGKGVYYSADLVYLRQLIQNDLDKLPDNIANNSSVLLPRLSGYPQLQDALLIGTKTYLYTRQSKPLPDLITALAGQAYHNQDVANAMDIADMISTAMRAGADSKELWVSPADLSPARLNGTDQTVRFFYGLLFEQLRTANLIPLGYTDSQAAQLLAEMITFINDCNAAYDYIKSNKFSVKSPDDAILYIRSCVQPFSVFLQSSTLNARFVISADAVREIDHYLDIAGLLIKKDYQRAVPLLIADWGAYLPATTGTPYTRTISFLSQLATVDKPGDMKNLLDDYALPIGSSSIKRSSTFNVSLNGYVGFTAGAEWALADGQKQRKTDLGLTAPIGISVTGWGSLTGFVSLLDLGTLVNARLGNDVNYYSDLKLEQFFSPGAGLYFNFPKMPLTIGAQFSYIPNLRTIKYNNGTADVTETHASVTRFNISALFDIPFLTLFNRTPKK
jgi:hypothetical protein